MFAALCQRAHPLKHSLAESIFVSRVRKNSEKNLRQPKYSLAGSLVSRGITVITTWKQCGHDKNLFSKVRMHNLPIFFLRLQPEQQTYRPETKQCIWQHRRNRNKCALEVCFCINAVKRGFLYEAENPSCLLMKVAVA